MVNGTSEATSLPDVRDFVIVCDGAGTYVGRPTGWGHVEDPDGKPIGRAMMRLEPAYAMACGWSMPAPGQVGRMRAIAPLELMASATSIDVAPVSVHRLETWDDADRAVIAQEIKAAEGLRAQIRARRSGLAIVPGLPRNLTDPGRRH